MEIVVMSTFAQFDYTFCTACLLERPNDKNKRDIRNNFEPNEKTKVLHTFVSFRNLQEIPT